MRQSIFIIVVLSIFTSCQCRQQVILPISTIDSILQVNATSTLEEKIIRDKCPIWAGYSNGSSDRSN